MPLNISERDDVTSSCQNPSLSTSRIVSSPANVPITSGRCPSSMIEAIIPAWPGLVLITAIEPENSRLSMLSDDIEDSRRLLRNIPGWGRL